MAAGAFPYKSVRWDIVLGRTYLTSFSRLYLGRAKVPLHEIPNELFDSLMRIRGPAEGMHDLSQQGPKEGQNSFGDPKHLHIFQQLWLSGTRTRGLGT